MVEEGASNMGGMLTPVMVPPTATRGTRALASTQTLSGASGVWGTLSDAGGVVSITLPVAGTYQVIAMVGAVVWSNTGGGYVMARLYDQTSGAVVSNSEFMVARTGAAGYGSLSHRIATWANLLTVSGSRELRLQCMRDESTSWNTSTVAPVILSYVLLSR